MSSALLTLLVVIPVAAVLVVLFLVMWWRRSSTWSAAVAVLAGGTLAVWASASAVIAASGLYRPPQTGVPPVGMVLALALVGLAVALVSSRTLRALLSDQRHLIRLNVWRLLGAVFLLLALSGQVPALWAVPAGVGDVLVGATAFWVASGVQRPGGRRRAIIFNLLGMLDLVVAVSLGIMTNPGSTQVIRTTPTAELLTRFPLTLVPTFLVPLAFALHIASLWQLVGSSWAAAPARSPAPAPAARGGLAGTPTPSQLT